jgi:exopolysaccharide production protein ExoZ
MTWKAGPQMLDVNSVNPLNAGATISSRVGKPVTSRKNEKFGGIQAGRAAAAILVIFAHASAIISEPRFYGTLPFDGALSGFGVGVDFFFVLSGFIIAWVHWDDIGRKERLQRYMRNRFLRIYPPYWGVLLPLSLMYFIFPGAGQPSQHDPVNFLFSVLLAPYPEHPILGVAWTLVHEMIFYVLFGLIILFGRRAIWGLPAWGAMIIALQISFERLPFPLSILFNEFNLQFLLGIASALWLRKGKIPFPALVAAVAILVFFLTMLFGRAVYEHSLITRAIFGLSSAAFILGVVELERGGRLIVPPLALLIGAASYSIYLTHGIALSATIQVVTQLCGPKLPMVPLILVLVASGVTLGTVYHLAIEKPLAGALRKFLPSGPYRD